MSRRRHPFGGSRRMRRAHLLRCVEMMRHPLIRVAVDPAQGRDWGAEVAFVREASRVRILRVDFLSPPPGFEAAGGAA